MYILGINAVFHDSAACILKDGKLLAAAEEERFTQIKHGKRPTPFSTYELPFNAIYYCLTTAGIHLKDVDHIAYSFDPELYKIDIYPGLDNFFLTAIKEAPHHLIGGYPHHLREKFTGATTNDFEWHYVDHHVAHAASAFYPSPFKSAAVVTLDGRGENATTTYSVGKDKELNRFGFVDMPNSLGMLYEQVTTYLGFLHSSDEYKVMALASYGQPIFADQFRDMIKIGENGKYTISNENLIERFGPSRQKGDPFTKYHFDISHSLQLVLEEKALALINWVYETTKEENLCMAGGIALNCVLNARIRDKSKFKNVWVQPAAGDAGTALGAAISIDLKVRNESVKADYEVEGAYWGPEFSDEQIEKFLKWAKVPYKKLDNVAEETADILADNKIIGWFQGRMEFGPRALGSRSILASPIHPSMQAKLNEVKDREDFRPVAPAVLEEDAGEWFENAKYSPYMLFVYNVQKDKADKIPAVRHVDGTARIQTVNRQQHERYYDLLKAFKAKTGVPVLVNTSFNTLGKPIVCTPRDAVECFWSSPFDALVIGSFLIKK
jgi:carbamoyltransferase